MFFSEGTLVSLLETDLYSSGWDGALAPYPGQSPHQVAMMSLRNSLVKKYLPGTSPTNDAGDAAALALFIECNSACGRFDLSSTPRAEHEEIVLGEMKQFLWDFFNPRPRTIAYTDVPTRKLRRYATPRDPVLTEQNIVRFMDMGPGASIGAKSTNFYTKVANSSMSSTSSTLHDIYVQTIAHHPVWSACEGLRQHVQGNVIVEGSRLSFVPKNRKISRTICTEPVLNMMFQLGIGGAIAERLKEVVGIDLSNQPAENARLARVGSETGKFGTIDLSSASDTISLSLVRDLLPRHAFWWLQLTRSPTVTLPGGERVELQMISSMGNGFTFPLQTMLFTALVLACYKVLGIIPRHYRGHAPGSSNFAVFGDDIIVRYEAYGLVCRMLNLLGFKVNQDKSFNDGYFRESCGSDYQSGYNVRGVYIQKLRDVNDCFSAINRLNRWSAAHWVPLPTLVQGIKGQIPLNLRGLCIPFDEQDDVGIKVPLKLAQHVRHRRDGVVKYRTYELETAKLKLPVRSERKSRELDWFENPDGLLLSFVAGRIRDGSIGLRSKSRCAKISRRESPRWDWIPLAGGESPQYRDHWKVITEVNLFG